MMTLAAADNNNVACSLADDYGTICHLSNIAGSVLTSWMASSR